MNDAKKIIHDLFDKMISLKVREIELGYGSFVTIGFGKDISYEIKVRGKMETRFRPEWRLWVYMCFWELKKNDQLFCHSEEDKVKMSESLKSFEGKKMLRGDPR